MSATLDFELRRARPADRERIYEIHCEGFRPSVEATWGWDEAEQLRIFDDRWERQLDGCVECWAIVADGRVVGDLRFEERASEIFLARIVLAPEARGQGIGTALVQRILDRARACRVPVVLSVLRANPRARALYERLGFALTRTEGERWHMRAD